MPAEQSPEERKRSERAFFEQMRQFPPQPFQPQQQLPPGFHPGGPVQPFVPWSQWMQELARIYQVEGWKKAEEYLERGRQQ